MLFGLLEVALPSLRGELGYGYRNWIHVSRSWAWYSLVIERRWRLEHRSFR
jgi:hypothetical protein